MQQINLYLPEFRPNREPLRSAQMLWAALALLLVLILMSAYGSYRNNQLRDHIATEQAALQAAQAQLQQLSAQQPQNQRAQLDAEIQRLQAERERRENILMVIANQDLGNSTGFSAQLQTLARQSLDTLSLTQFSLQDGGRYVELAGRTHNADQVPLYLQRLRSEQSFAPVRFGVLSVKRGETPGSPLLFNLAKAQNETPSAVDEYFGGKR